MGSVVVVEVYFHAPPTSAWDSYISIWEMVRSARRYLAKERPDGPAPVQD